MRGTHAYTSYTGPQQPLHYLTQDRPLNKNIRKTQAPIQYPSSRTPKYLSPNTHPHPLRKPWHLHNTTKHHTRKKPPSNQREGNHPLTRREGPPFPVEVRPSSSSPLIHKTYQPVRNSHMHPLQQCRGQPRTHNPTLPSDTDTQSQIKHTITRTPLDKPRRSVQLPARRRGAPEHTHFTHTHTITQPCWLGRERPVSKAGEALLVTGGARFEDPPGLYCSYAAQLEE